MAGALLATVTACGGEADTQLRTPDGSVISTVTTRVAKINIVNADRDYADTCLAPTATDDGEDEITSVTVTDPALLDALCALGAGPTVKALDIGDAPVPAYLGPQLADAPRTDAASAKPQVVLTTRDTADRAKNAGDADVVTVETGDNWRKTYTDVAAAMHRTESGAERLGEFDTEAKRVGNVMDAVHNQVSLVRFTADATVAEGTAGFAEAILSQVGVQRPPSQRGAEPTTLTDENLEDADADLIYVAHDGDAGLERAEKLFDTDRWQDMGAPTWQRVLWVNDDIWYHSSGLAAAWLVLNDLKSSLNGGSSGD